MLDVEDAFRQGLASPNVFDIENGLDTARYAGHCGDAPRGRNREKRHVAEPVFLDLFDESGREIFEEGILQVIFGLEDRERTFHESDVCRLVVSPELDLLHGVFAKLDSFVAIVSKLELAEHVGKSHDAQADPPSSESGLLLSTEGVAPLIPGEHIVEKTNSVPSGFFEGCDIQFCALRVRIVDESRKVDAADAAVTISLQGLLRTRVGAYDFHSGISVGGRIAPDGIPEEATR